MALIKGGRIYRMALQIDGIVVREITKTAIQCNQYKHSNKFQHTRCPDKAGRAFVCALPRDRST
jgi:hypothetical protein